MYYKSCLNQGDEFYKNGEYSSALSCYKEILNNNPKSRKALNGVGLCLYQQNNYVKAIPPLITANILAKDAHEFGVIFCAMVQKNAIVIVKQLLSAGVTPFWYNKETGCNALHWAIENDSAEMSSLLLEYEIDICKENNDRETPLYFAGKKQAWRSLEVILKYIVKNRNDFAEIIDCEKLGSILVNAARHNQTNIVTILLKLGATTTWYHEHNEYYSLHWAIENSNWQMFLALKKHASSTEILDSALDLSIKQKKDKVLDSELDCAIQQAKWWDAYDLQQYRNKLNSKQLQIKKLAEYKNKAKKLFVESHWEQAIIQCNQGIGLKLNSASLSYIETLCAIRGWCYYITGSYEQSFDDANYIIKESKNINLKSEAKLLKCCANFRLQKSFSSKLIGKFTEFAKKIHENSMCSTQLYFAKNQKKFVINYAKNNQGLFLAYLHQAYLYCILADNEKIRTQKLYCIVKSLDSINAAINYCSSSSTSRFRNYLLISKQKLDKPVAKDSKISSKKVDEENWLVFLVKKDTHAELLIELVTEEGAHEIHRADFLPAERNRNGYYGDYGVGFFTILINEEKKGEVRFEQANMKQSIFQQFKLDDGWYKCWEKPAAKVQKMIDSIQKDQNKDLIFQIRGKHKQGDGHNCVSWSYEKLAIIDIYPERSFFDGVVVKL